jgi:eukaryotic-like serine/threonine-protein kinase
MASGLKFGQYQLGARLAAGGMGEVFIARRRGAGAFEKEVALKLLLPHFAEDTGLVGRFYDEARLAAKMNHPNIVHIFDVGEVDGRPYLAMALIEGVSLSALMRAVAARGEQVPLPLVRLIATGLLEALAYAHELPGEDGRPLGVVHRDVTPSNILVSRAGAVFLSDFGLARASINLHATQPGGLRGKAAYVAPEQIQGGRRLTHQADLFSAGVTLFHLLTLKSPFLRPSDVGTMEAVLNEAPPDVLELRSDATAGMVAALERALAKSPEQRFPSARAFRESFGDGPVATAPELGEYVVGRCGPALAVFGGRSAGGAVAQSPGGERRTESLVSGDIPPPGRGPLLGGLARWWGRGGRGDTTTASPEGAGPNRSEPGSSNASGGRRRALAPWLLLAGLVLAAGGWWLVSSAVQTPVTATALSEEERRGDVAEATPSVAAASTESSAPPGLQEGPALVRPAEGHEASQATEPATRTESAASGGGSGSAGAVPPRPNEQTASRPRPTKQLPPVVPVRVGYLSADARPWARVLLDGKEIERTPLSRFPVPVGRHRLVFKGPSGQVDSRSIVVKEGEVVTVRADFGR